MSKPANPMRGTNVFIFIFVFSLFLIPAVGYRIYAGLDSGPKTQCISNMKQLGTAMRIYADANDDRMPAGDWYNASYPYTKNRTLYSCDKVINAGKEWGYAMNYEVLGIAASEPDQDQVMLFETDALAPGVIANLAAVGTPRHGTRMVTTRMDTSTKTILPEDARKLGSPLPPRQPDAAPVRKRRVIGEGPKLPGP